MAWRVARSLLTFHAQLRAAYPRAAPPATDVNAWGTIGDTSHESTSDHSPHNFPGWGNDIVTAADWPHAPTLGLDAGAVAEALRLSRDARIKYVIFNRRMFSSYYSGTTPGWTWRTYTGSDPHNTHGHLSVVGDARADAEQPWQIGANPMAIEPTDPDWQALIYRVHALVNGLSVVAGGPLKGAEHVWVVEALKRIEAKLAEPAPVVLSADDRAAIVADLKAAVLAELPALVPTLDELKTVCEDAVESRLDGATIKTAP